MSLVSLLNSEPIAGYKIVQRLGAGGYGEVWKAEAPGGLTKAIKFIYGYLTDEKAARELNALNRIKQLRHPFLLSLERIEVLEGQLVIVTELADMSLKDRFAACIEKGLPAIPRQELLAYMRDAADALDFLADNTLQHLDVKPENLLLVGGRVKVADFGLVREIQDRTCSMMGGMTPVYAAPESFDGRPGAFSDQYSLAIVYQEMLTGVVPFPGTTAAQLASQHLHGRPRLETLPASERPIIAKALSKVGTERYKNCRALIDALYAADRADVEAIAKNGVAPSTANRDTDSNDDQDTDALRTSPRSTPTPGRLSPSPERRTPQARIRRSPSAAGGDSSPADTRTKTAPPARLQTVVDLPRVTVAENETGLRPMLLIGIGGTGTRIVSRMWRRLENRFGEMSKLPIFQSLLLDTDCKSLAQQTRGEDRQQSGSASLAMPLRRPQEYRSDSLDILQWLSRRWLYNIPRSLQTEGFRPLGRLAMVDHAGALLDCLRKMLSDVASDRSLATTQEHTGQPARERAPRVFVVASISGGTGGGMALEVAYTARYLLSELGLSDAGVCALLTHSTDRKAAAKSLAIANAYACLSEMDHYARSMYPGEPACNVPAFDREKSTVPTYFSHLGENLNDDDFAQAIDSLAEYLYLDCATAGGAFFDKCRGNGADVPAAEELTLRTFGVCRLTGAQDELTKNAAELACGHLLERWTNGPKKSAQAGQEERIASMAHEIVAQFKLDATTLRAHARAAAEQAFVPNRPAVVDQIARFAAHDRAATQAKSFEEQWRACTPLVQYQMGLAEKSSADLESPPVVELADRLADAGKAWLGDVAERLAQRVAEAADEPELRLPGALKAIDRLADAFRALEAELTAENQTIDACLAALAEPPVEAAPPSRRAAKIVTPPTPLDQAGAVARLTEHAEALIEREVNAAAGRLVRGLKHRLAALKDMLAGLRRDLALVSAEFSVRPLHAAPGVAAAADGDVTRDFAKELEAAMPGVFGRLDKRVDAEIRALHGGLASLAKLTSDQMRLLPQLLRTAARAEVVEALRQMDIVQIVLGHGADGGFDRNRLRHSVEKARPTALQCGGGKRLLLVTPPCNTAAELGPLVEEELQENVSVVYDSDCDIVACYEAQGLPLSAVADLVANGDPTCAEAARRLHTRVDVKWSGL